MEFIRTHEFEYLLLHYKQMQSLIETFTMEVEAVMNEKGDDVIYDSSVRRNIEGLPVSTGKISDRTGQIALSKNNRLSKEQSEALKEIRKDIVLFETTLRKIDISMRALRSKQQDVVKLRFFESLTWAEVADKLFISIETAQRFKKMSIKIMVVVCSINLDDYNDINKILERK